MPIRFIAIVQIGLMVLVLFRPLFPFIQYSLDKAYIAKNLCIKKEVKDNCCQGKCYLKKQIEKSAESNDYDTKKQDKKQRTVEINDFVYAILRLYFQQLELFSPHSGNGDAHLSTYHHSIFIPPRLLFSL